MKTAVAYYRISDREQSNYSISGQRQSVGEYVARMGIKLLGEYEDEGFSAGNFNRPDWIKMMRDLRKYKPDFVLSTRYNRVARMAAEGLTAVENAEKKYGCLFLAVEEVSYVDTLSPHFYKMRGEMFVNAEFERRVIRDQGMFGRFNGLRVGKFLNKPPYGYLPDPDKKSVPIKDPATRHIIEAIGRMYFEEGQRSFGAITSEAKKLGFALKGRSAVKNILKNPAYFGLVRFNAYKRQPGGFADSQHEAYWPKQWYYSMQQELEVAPAIYNTYDPALPLRGLVFAPCCGNKMTGGKSRGQSGTYYPNYKCNTCKGSNVSGQKADRMLHEILSCIRLSPADIERLKAMTLEQLKQLDQSREVQRQRLEKLIRATQDRIDTMDYRMLTVGVIAESTYLEHRGKAERDLNGYRVDLEEVQKMGESLDTSVLNFFAKAPDVTRIYQRMDVPKKQRFLSLLFGEIELSRAGYRTSKVPSVFAAKMLATNYLSLLPEPSLAGELGEGAASAPHGANIEPVKELILIANLLSLAA